MKFSRQLAKVELVAFGALVAAAFALASFAGIQTSLHPSPMFNIIDSVRVVFLYTLVIGCIPVLAFGAPLYATLLYRGRASWSAAFVIGAVPGVILLFFTISLGLWSLACGVAVALATHAVCAPGSNHSSKRTCEKAARRLTPALKL
jgi:hypothetical protein